MKLKNIPKDQYDYKTFEPEMRKEWLDKQLYKPEYDPKQKKVFTTNEMKEDGRTPYCIVCPPPNAYGRPHMGNLSGNAYQDAMGRYARMNGKKVLLIPGKDHAGLEGEGVFVRDVLEKEGINKFSLTREEFYKKIWDFNMVNKQQALKDEQTIGLSADFDRDIFTLDERIVDTVLSTFVELYNENMVYKGVRLVNWDPKARSVIADNQCERKEREGSIYTIKYPIVKQKAWIFSYKNNFLLNKIRAGELNKIVRALNPEEKDRYFGDIQKGDIVVCKDITDDQSSSVYKKVSDVQIFNSLEKAHENIVWKEVFGDDIFDILDVDKKFAELDLNYDMKVRRNGLVSITFEELSNEDYLSVATTRPETMFGDTAVAVNPTDERFFHLQNRNVIIPIADRVVPIITDGKVEKDFGTGCLKITPAHAADDFEIMLRWNSLVDKEMHEHEEVVGFFEKKKISYINVIDKDLKLCGPVGPKYTGIKYNAAKEIIIKDLTEAGLFIEEKKLIQNIQVSERTGAVVEPMMSSQWFIDIDKIRKPVIDMVRNGEVKIHPKFMEKKFYYWMENLRDWAISRSLWWGYRLPVWYRGEISERIDDSGQVALWINIDGEFFQLNPSNQEHMRVQLDKPEGEGWIQDPDVFDTWFSSGQWPYATLMAHDLMDTFYPTEIMETGFDILENWVSRMMMFSYFKLKKIPFKDVYLHGMVKGTDGQKMSKSRKNIIPIDDVEDKYGIDTLRMCYFYQNKAGTSYAITFDKLKNFRNFNNKIWNAAKYVLRSIDQAEGVEKISLDKNILHKETYLSEENKIMCELFNERHAKTTDYMNRFKFGIAAEKLYHSIWHQYCDIYIEQTKELLKSSDDKIIEETLSTLLLVLTGYIKALHPFIPYVTEKIYTLLQENDLVWEDVESLMYTEWKM